MRHPLIRQGEGPTAAHNRIQTERDQLRATLDRIKRELATPDHTPTTGTAGGDSRKLRGIPAIGRTVQGAIPGTDPETELIRRQPRH